VSGGGLLTHLWWACDPPVAGSCPAGSCPGGLVAGGLVSYTRPSVCPIVRPEPAAGTEAGDRSMQECSDDSLHVDINQGKVNAVGGSLACWTQAQKGLGSNRSRDAVG